MDETAETLPRPDWLGHDRVAATIQSNCDRISKPASLQPAGKQQIRGWAAIRGAWAGGGVPASERRLLISGVICYVHSQ